MERRMIAIRLAKQDWGKAWRALIEIAPVRLIADDPVYEVLPAHLELLAARGFSYEILTPHFQKLQEHLFSQLVYLSRKPVI
jgi:hypothetical protein